MVMVVVPVNRLYSRSGNTSRRRRIGHAPVGGKSAIHRQDEHSTLGERIPLVVQFEVETGREF